MRGITVEVFNKGGGMPRAFVEQVFKTIKVRNVGIATVERTEGLISERTVGEPTVNGVMDLQKALDGRGAGYIFGEYKDGTLKEDFQPAILMTDDKDKAIAVGLMVGEYPGFDKNDSHTPEYHVACEYLFPLIDEKYTAHKGDIDKIIADLNTKMTVMNMKNLIVGEGAISLMFSNGKTLHFYKTDKVREYSWGRVSDSVGWTEAPMASGETLIAQQIPDLATRLKAAIKTVDDSSKPVIGQQPTINLPADATFSKGEGFTHGAIQLSNFNGGNVIPEHIANQFQLHFPPTTVQTFKDLRKWYKNKAKYHATDDEIKARIGIFSRSDLDKIRLLLSTEKAKTEGAEKVTIQPTAAEKLAAAVTKPFQKDTTTKHVPPGTGSTVRESVPYLSEDVMKRMKPHLDKLRDGSGNLLPADPKQYVILESEVPSFVQKAGLKGLSQTFRLSYDDLVKMAKDAPEAIALLVMDLRKGIVEAWQKTPRQVVTDEKTVEERLKEAAQARRM